MHVLSVEPKVLFQALADPVRIRIVRLLAATQSQSCLCELVDSLLQPQYALSKHVKALRHAGILSAEKDGRWVYHGLVNAAGLLGHLYSAVLAVPDTDGQFAADLKRFKSRMSLRERGRCRVGIVTQQLRVS